jgi:hypothetical protein
MKKVMGFFIFSVVSFSPSILAGFSLTQKIYDNVPYTLYLHDQGFLKGHAYYPADHYPPQAIASYKSDFIIQTDQPFIDAGNFSYLVASSDSPYFNNGCRIVSISVDGYGEVQEKVEPLILNPAGAAVECSSGVVDGAKPFAYLYLNEPGMVHKKRPH